MLKKTFLWRLFPSTWVSLLLVMLLFPLAIQFPGWWSWENGPLENGQVVILVSGVILTRFIVRHNAHDRRMRNFWLWTIPLWLLVIARELSWGRVFFEPIVIGGSGPVFPALRDVWYGDYVYPVNTVIILTTLVQLWRNCQWSKLRQLQFPAVDVVLLIAAALASQLVFEKTLIPAFSAYSQMLEEGAEFIVYWCMVSILMVVKSQSSRI